MNKKELKNTVNKAVYKYAESLGYQVYDDGDGSCVTFRAEGDNIADSIDYSRSHHDTYTLNWSSNECKADAEKIEQYAKQILQQEEYNYALLFPLQYKEGLYHIADIIDVDGNPWVERDEALRIMREVKQMSLYSQYK